MASEDTITALLPQSFRADLGRALDLSVPLNFSGAQPSAFGAPAASGEAYRNTDFVGDVALGGSCNCRQYRLIPHCNGTHTECIGHLTRQAVNVTDIVPATLEPASLLSVHTLTPQDCKENTDPAPASGDKLITAQAIAAQWQKYAWPQVPVRALALRTLPNDADKQT